MLLASSPAVPLHVNHALSTVGHIGGELSAITQLRSLSYAVRWESTITPLDFVSDELEGERWLVWAAGPVCV